MKIPRIKRGIAMLLCAVMTFGISIFTAIESVADDTVTVDKLQRLRYRHRLCPA